MRRITPRTCLWPLVGSVCSAFALSIGLTYRSNHHCYAGTCGEWLFPLQARLHIVVWYSWIAISITILSIRAFRPWIRRTIARPLGRVSFHGKRVRISGMLLIFWILALYGILVGVWWRRLRDYFTDRGGELAGNHIVAAVALTGHLADVSMGMVLLPVSRHSALISFFRLSPSSAYVFHMVMAYVLFGLVIIHGSLYAAWAAIRSRHSESFRMIFPLLNPTYLYKEVWPGNTSSLAIWRASLIVTGSITALIMLIMFLTSIPIVRRRHFNFFYFTHLLSIVAVIIICLHASTMFYCTVPGLLMWLIDWGMRVAELAEKIDGKLIALGNGWYTITLPLPRKRLSGCACHSPLAHFYIHHTRSSIREIHPFTTISHLASKKSSIGKGGDALIEIQFLFRANENRQSSTRNNDRQWTNRLGSLADVEKQIMQTRQEVSTPCESQILENGGTNITLRLEGPYFTIANPERFKTVICLVAGTGLSGALAIAAAFVGGACTANCQQARVWQRCIVFWTVRESDYTPIPFFDDLACEGLVVHIHKTGGARPRLDLKTTLDRICVDGADSWCYISGPGGFITAADRACGEIKDLTWFTARWD